MRTLLFAGMALSCAAALSAQSQVKSSADRDTTKRVTVSGCVERADQITPNDSTTTVDSLSFVLMKPMAEKTTGTAGTVTSDAAQAKTGTDPRLYRLDGTVDQLNSHVGQKVEIVGSVADAPTEPKGTMSPANVPRLKVESVKMLSATCPR
jgi:hypothetical protein